MRNGNMFWRNAVWKPIVTRNYGLLYRFLGDEGDARYSNLFFAPTDVETLTVSEGTIAHVFQSEKTGALWAKTILEDSLRRQDYANDLKKVYSLLGPELLDSAIKLSNASSGEQEFERFSTAWKKFAPGLKVTVFIGRACFDKLFEFLCASLNKPKAEVELLINTLTLPVETTPSFEEETELLKIVAEAQNKGISRSDSQIMEKLQAHCESFNWIPVSFVDEPWSIKDFEKQFDYLFEAVDCRTRLNEVLENRRETIEKRDELFQELDLSDESRRLILVLREGTFLNEYRKSIFSKSNLLARKFFERLAKDAETRWESFLFLTPGEIATFLQTREFPKEKIEKRLQWNGLLNWEGKTRLLSDEELLFAKKLIPKEQKAASVEWPLKGVIGSRGVIGKVIGKAKVIRTISEGGKLETGDVLVAKMTSVDFIPLMRKAIAFVTDEGGITCHAAIVAREMNKPCIIGTKVATIALKDGDLIEVDANNGLVRKMIE
ncbi:MAG: PEP-utilizing enzyme [Candidatus Micrarchaeota archaeon]